MKQLNWKIEQYIADVEDYVITVTKQPQRSIKERWLWSVVESPSLKIINSGFCDNPYGAQEYAEECYKLLIIPNKYRAGTI